MGFFDKLFGKKKNTPSKDNSTPIPPERMENKKSSEQSNAAKKGAAQRNPEPKEDEVKIEVIQPDDNPWKIMLVDLRPITQHMLSTSQDPTMAANAVSYGQEDGLFFLEQTPEVDKTIAVDLEYKTNGKLEDGVLFIPDCMEHKWAIYYHQNKILFVRSWQRQVMMIADTVQEDNALRISHIHGEFAENQSDQFMTMFVDFLIRSHAMGEMLPAPLVFSEKENLVASSYWAFSAYGKMAHFGHFEPHYITKSDAILRTHTLLHISVARGDVQKIGDLLASGSDINGLASDGLSALHWALAADISILNLLLDKGADPNIASDEGATPIMNAVQSNQLPQLELLVSKGADVNAKDLRGFTSLHRAAEMGHTEVVKKLLELQANKDVTAEGHTPLSLAEARNNVEIVALLKKA